MGWGATGAVDVVVGAATAPMVGFEGGTGDPDQRCRRAHASGEREGDARRGQREGRSTPEPREVSHRHHARVAEEDLARRVVHVAHAESLGRRRREEGTRLRLGELRELAHDLLARAAEAATVGQGHRPPVGGARVRDGQVGAVHGEETERLRRALQPARRFFSAGDVAVSAGAEGRAASACTFASPES